MAMWNRFQRLHARIEATLIGLALVLAAIAYGVSRLMGG